MQAPLPDRAGDVEWLQSATDDEIRSSCHYVLWWPWGNHHDACLLLVDYADESSRPYLGDCCE